MTKDCEKFKKEIQEFQEIWDEFEQSYKDKVDARKALELLDEIMIRKDEIFNKYERLIMRISSFETFKYLSKKEGIDIASFDLFEVDELGNISGTFSKNGFVKIFIFDKDENFRIVDEIRGEKIRRIQTLRMKENKKIVGINIDDFFTLDLENDEIELKSMGFTEDICVAKNNAVGTRCFGGRNMYIKNKNLERIIEIPKKYQPTLKGAESPLFRDINYDEKITHLRE